MSSVYSLQKIPVSRLWRCRTICDHHTRFLCSLNNRSSTSWWFAWVCACGLALTLASKQSPGKHAARGVLWRMYKQGSERAEHGKKQSRNWWAPCQTSGSHRKENCSETTCTELSKRKSLTTSNKRRRRSTAWVFREGQLEALAQDRRIVGEWPLTYTQWGFSLFWSLRNM